MKIEKTEFALAPQPRSWGALILAVGLLFPLASVILTGFLSGGPIPRPVAMPLAVFLAGAITVLLLWNQRAQPAGVLRLEPGRLLFTAGVGPHIILAPSQLRDCVLSYDHVMIHRRGGPRIVINPARLTVSADTVMAALHSWMARGGDASAFDEASRLAAIREARRRHVLLVVRALAIGCALAVAALKHFVK